jgi:hypothetical protein
MKKKAIIQPELEKNIYDAIADKWGAYMFSNIRLIYFHFVANKSLKTPSYVNKLVQKFPFVHLIKVCLLFSSTQIFCSAKLRYFSLEFKTICDAFKEKYSKALLPNCFTIINVKTNSTIDFCVFRIRIN